MTQESPSPDELEGFRDYLHLLGRLQLDGPLRSKIDSSDLVQQTLAKAHQNWHQFRGGNQQELAGWLRRILANTLMDAARKYRKDLAQQQSLEVALEESSARLEAWLAADQSAPSEHAIRQEQLFQMATALAKLPENQRTAVEMHYLKELPLDEIAAAMEKTIASVAGLLRRGLAKLRELLDDSP